MLFVSVFFQKDAFTDTITDIFARKPIQKFKTASTGDALKKFLFITCNGYLLLLFLRVAGRID